MLRWSVAAGWLLAVACGSRVDGQLGVSRTSGASPVTDAGPARCSGTGKLFANAGTGNLCAIKDELGTPRTARAPLSYGNPDGGLPTEHCGPIGPSDGAGDIIIQSDLLSLSILGKAIALYAFDSGGAPLGQVAVQRDLPLGTTEFPLRSGWLVDQFLFGARVRISVYPPSLQAPSDAFFSELPNFLTFWTPGGGAAVAGPVSPGDPSCPLGSTLQFATSFDATGAAVFRDVSLGCFPSFRGISVGRNAAGDVLVLAGDSVAWHVTPDGIVSPVQPSPFGSLYPLIDGRFANRGDEAWLDTLDINGNVSPPPCWLAERPDVGSFQIVLGGQAYLAYHSLPATPGNPTPQPQPCDRYAELILADGTSCGFIPVTGTSGCLPGTVSVGLDGTLTTLDLGSCTASFWPGAFL